MRASPALRRLHIPAQSGRVPIDRWPLAANAFVDEQCSFSSCRDESETAELASRTGGLVTSQLMQIALLCAPLIHPVTMGAIISVESGGNPFAVSINYPQRLAALGWSIPEIAAQPRTAAEATRLVSSLERQGFSTSLGLAQINTEHLREFGISYTQLFDPCTNLKLAERILLRCKQQVDALAMTVAPQQLIARTLSCYNSGSDTLGLHNGYVEAIVTQARALSITH
jgi:type IV secretion system protein VirB1